MPVCMRDSDLTKTQNKELLCVVCTKEIERERTGRRLEEKNMVALDCNEIESTVKDNGLAVIGNEREIIDLARLFLILALSGSECTHSRSLSLSLLHGERSDTQN
jgi:hypothetical protein